MQVTGLPAAAWRVIAGYLQTSDVVSCRLASQQLSDLIQKPQGRRLWVVASSFNQQLQADEKAAMVQRCSQQIAALAPVGSLDDCSQGVNTRQPVAAVQDALSTGTVKPVTVRSLAAAAQCASCVNVLVDASRPLEPWVWQQLFTAVLASGSVQTLIVTEYASRFDGEVGAAILMRAYSTPHATHHHQHTGDQQHAQSALSDNSSSSSSSSAEALCKSEEAKPTLTVAAGSAWLPALVSATQCRAELLQQQQQQVHQSSQPPGQQGVSQKLGAPLLDLTLQLLAPLHYQHALQLLDIPALLALSVQDAPPWLRPNPAEGCVRPGNSVQGLQGLMAQHIRQALQLDVVLQLHQLPQLRSLTCTCSFDEARDQGQAHTALDSCLRVMGAQLTQLKLGVLKGGTTGSFQYAVAAPFRHMASLQALTCQPGLTLDPEYDNDTSTQQLQQPDPAQHPRSAITTTSSSSSVAASAQPPALLPSLTKLQLSDQATVLEMRDLLRLVVSSPAACSQLQQLHLPLLLPSMFPDSDDEDDDYDPEQPWPSERTLQLLAKLHGLRQLDIVACGPDQLSALVTAVSSQLQGLTVTTDEGPARHGRRMFPGEPHQVSLCPILTQMSQLTSLKILGSTGAVLDARSYLPCLTQHITGLRQFCYVGCVNAVRQDGFQLLPGYLPAGLQGLTIVVASLTPEGWEEELGGRYIAHPGCFPPGLTSLKLRGFRLERPVTVDDSSLWLGWELLPHGLRQLEFEADVPHDWPRHTGVAPRAGCSSGGGCASSSNRTAVLQPEDPSGTLQQQQQQEWASSVCGWRILPELKSLALYLKDAEDAYESDDLHLHCWLDELSGLTTLTNLYISSCRQYRAGDPLQALSSLRQLHILTLDVDLRTVDTSQLQMASCMGSCKASQGGLRSQEQQELQPEASMQHMQAVEAGAAPAPLCYDSFKALIRELTSSLKGCSGLRLLRVPRLGLFTASDYSSLEQQRHNCLLVEADDTFIPDSSTLSWCDSHEAMVAADPRRAGVM